MTISIHDRRVLYQRSGNRCAFEGCWELLTTAWAEGDNPAVLSDIAHIVARHARGPRGEAEMANEDDLDGYHNLILLCLKHHRIVDTQASTYAPETLRGMKARHEQAIEALLAAPDQLPVERRGIFGDWRHSDLAQLPPLARRAIDRVYARSPQTAGSLLDALVQPGIAPGDSLGALVADPTPQYLDQYDGLPWTVIGEAAAAYLERSIAADAYARAARTGASPRHRWMALAALQAWQSGEIDHARAFLEEARTFAAPSDPFLALVDATLQSDWPAIQAAAGACRAAGVADTLVGVLALRATAMLVGIEAALVDLRDLVNGEPESTSIMMSLTRALLNHASQQRPWAERVVMAKEALDLALRARDLRRAWRGPSYEAVAQACEALLALEEVDAAARLATLVAEGGEATEAEASDSACVYVAALGLLLRDETGRATALAEGMTRPWYRSTFAGLLAESRSERLIAVSHYRDALAAAGDDEELRWKSVSHLALAGEWPIEGMDAIPGITPETMEWLEAQAAISRHDFRRAIEIGRQRRNTSERHAFLLFDGYVAEGRVSLALDEANHAASTFADPRFLARAAHLLAREGRRVEAESVGIRALALMHEDTVIRRRLHRLLIDCAGARWDLGTVVDHARAFLQDDPADPVVRWALVRALAMDLQLEEAWGAMQSGELLPGSEVEVFVWMFLQKRFGTVENWLPTATQLGERHLSAVNVAAYFVWMTRNVPVTEDQELATRVAHLITAIQEKHPENEYFKVVNVKDDAEGVALLQRLLAERAAVYDFVAERVARGRWPVGRLVVDLGGTYTEFLLRGLRAGFRIHATSSDLADVSDAAAAVAAGGEVAVDLSSLVTASLIPEAWSSVVALFHRLQGSEPARQDLFQTYDDDAQAELTAQFDESGNPVFVATSQDALAPLRQRIGWMWDSRTTLSWSAVPSAEELPGDPEDPRWLPWLGTVRLAAHRGLPLLCDDLALRQIARERSVQTFPLSRLLLHLRDHNGFIEPVDPTRVAAIVRMR